MTSLVFFYLSKLLFYGFFDLKVILYIGIKLLNIWWYSSFKFTIILVMSRIYHFRVPFDFLCFKTSPVVHKLSNENEFYSRIHSNANQTYLLIFIWMVVHQDSFWNRGKRQLGNGQLECRISYVKKPNRAYDYKPSPGLVCSETGFH